MPKTYYLGGVCDALSHDVAQSRRLASAKSRATPRLLTVVVGLAALAAWVYPLQAGTIYIPNGSFEISVVPTNITPAITNMDYWQKSPQPVWYDPSSFGGYSWDSLTGTFYNLHTTPPDTFIDNCDGTQAVFLFAVPQNAIFQDYDSIYGTNTTPSHDFNATFKVNCAYTLTVGVIGGGGGMTNGATLQLSLYYRDASSDMVTVAATTVTNSAALFPTNTHFVDFSVQLPGVLPTNDWANQNIGVQIASTAGVDFIGGYWDIDNVRLIETPLPALLSPQVTNNQFSLILQSQPGLRFEILANTNSAAALSNWTSLGNVTNTSGTITFVDPAAPLVRRFYRAHQLQ